MHMQTTHICRHICRHTQTYTDTYRPYTIGIVFASMQCLAYMYPPPHLMTDSDPTR